MKAAVFTAPRALAQLLEAGRWWRENRPAAAIVVDDHEPIADVDDEVRGTAQ